MRISSTIRLSCLVFAASLIPGGSRLTAADAPLRVLASNGVKSVFVELIPQWEKVSSYHANIQFGSAAVLKQRIDDGEDIDVVILTSGLLDQLVAEKKIAADSHPELARVGIGLGIRAGSSKQNISTPDALKSFLARAKSIAYSEQGAIRPQIEATLTASGFKGKALIYAEAGKPQAMVAGGTAEAVISLVSEILSVPGIELLGAFPPEMQTYTVFGAGLGTHIQNPEVAQSFLKFITSQESGVVFKAKGLEPVRPHSHPAN
jgi:molybdate transport system substrate-binding protein